MKNDGNRMDVAPKKSYAKPSISEMKLRPEEAILGNCKTSDTAGPGGSTCTSAGACNTLGS